MMASEGDFLCDLHLSSCLNGIYIVGACTIVKNGQFVTVLLKTLQSCFS